MSRLVLRRLTFVQGSVFRITCSSNFSLSKRATGHLHRISALSQQPLLQALESRHTCPFTATRTTCARGGGRKLSSRVHTSTCEVAEHERPPRAQERLPTCPTTCNLPCGVHGTRNRHPETASRQIPRLPRFRGPRGQLPTTLLPWGLARETRLNLTTFGLS